MAKHSLKKYFDASGNLIVKPYRMMDLCIIFDVHYKTLHKWIQGYREEIGDRRGIYYNAAQVEVMLGKFGRPHIAAPS
ncbi:MAG TPA: hypothetical protein VF939_08985 [Puia sp.]